MTTLYKLTDQNMRTYRGFQWEIGKRFKASGHGPGLCSDGYLHAYEHPGLALFLNPVHAGFSSPRLFQALGVVKLRDGQLKCGVKSLTLTRELDLAVTPHQRVAFAIYCAKAACEDEAWNAWADKWLSGENRSMARSAVQSARSAAAYSARSAARSARAAAQSAWSAAYSADSAHAAYSAADSANSAARSAADSAVWLAQSAACSADLKDCADRALAWEDPCA